MSRFDIVLGHYVFCVEYFCGPRCPLYEKLCRIMRYFNPGRLFSEERFHEDPNGEYIGARNVYDALVEKYEGTHIHGMMERQRVTT